MTRPLVVFEDMPVTVKSFTRYNPDDTCTVVINARLSYESQQERYRHELEHLLRKDFEKEGSADSIELRAHGFA